MDVKKLDKYAELLLDTGKRNPLINFKNSKSSSVEVVCPSVERLFNDIREEGCFEVFDTKTSYDSDEYMQEALSEMNDWLDVGKQEQVSQQTAFEQPLNGDQKNARSTSSSDKKEKYIYQYRQKVKKNQILLYQPDVNPIGVLKKISKKAKEFIEETGVHVAYLAFGFILWSDKTSSENLYRAPVLLVPVQIEQSSAMGGFCISSAEDDVIINPTFMYKLESEFGVKLPDYNDESLSDYLDRISDVVKKLKWTVSNECQLGVFSFLKINMYRDLKDNADKILANPNVRALLGEPFDPLITEENGEEETPVINPLIELHNVVDADSSQMDAIEMAKSGKSFVLQGPPGTGKSQTITNIIAECLCDGKKVLFVSEKLAALNVVYDKLKQVGFEDFCLQLHSHKAKKKDVIADICHVLRKEKYSVSSMINKEIEIKRAAQQQLDDYAEELHKLQPMIDKSLYQLYDAYTAFGTMPDVAWNVDHLEEKGDAYLRETASLLEQYVDFIPSVGCDYTKNPWYGLRPRDASYQTKNEIKNTFEDVVQTLNDIVSLQKNLSDTCHIHSDDIHSLLTWNQFFRLASSVKIMTMQLLNPDVLHESLDVMNTLQTQCSDIRRLRTDLNASFNHIIDQLNASSYPLLNELYHKNIDIINKRADVFDDDDIRKLNDVFNQMISDLLEKNIDVVNRRADLNLTFTDEIFHLNAELYAYKLSHQFSRPFSRLFSSEYRKMMSELRVCNKTGEKISYQDALFIMQKLVDYQHKVAELDISKSSLQSIFGCICQNLDINGNQLSVQIHKKINEFHQMLADFRRKMSEFDQAQSSLRNLCGCPFQGLDTDWNQLADQLRELEPLLSQNIDFDALKAWRDFSDMRCVFAETTQKISNVLTDQALQRIHAVAVYFDNETFDILSQSCPALLERLQRCLNEMDKLNQWCHFQKLLDRLSEKQVVPYLQAAIALPVQPEHIVGAFQKHIYYLWIDRILEHSPVLSAFNRIAQDGSIQTFAEKDRLQFLINRAIIRAELCAKRPPANRMMPGSAVSILLREGEKKRKQKSIRTLLAEAGDAVQRIKPCFLMSPLSVSTFLAPDAVAFDVVIFDEASQIFPQDGIGAIYRAKQLIVVGDSKQMPPSNFFSTAGESDDDDEEAGDVTDFESILDLCSTTMAQLRLRWHYRSRFEQLITFSNKNFYDDTLVTFPSSRADAPGCGIDYEYVNGIFDRKTHTNLKEAERVVDLIYRHIEQYPNRSLGVVAFSIAQQSLIEDLLLKRRLATPQCEFFFRTDGNEPFFIKNLETVQGDERDTILFSIAYGFDKQGLFFHNFGPLNRVGGERRLNVAVTRAKCNVQLVASIHYTDIDLNRTKAEGAKLLREYLDFAENGNAALMRASKSSNRQRSDSQFECEVRAFLQNNGYDVEANVGCSACRVDIGLKQPNSQDYLLAIECDGETYRAAKNTRDRDRLRQEILERMGWQYHRVWSTEWFKNQSHEQQRLLDAVNRALHPSEIPEKKQETPLNEDAFEIPFCASNNRKKTSRRFQCLTSALHNNGYPYQ